MTKCLFTFLVSWFPFFIILGFPFIYSIRPFEVVFVEGPRKEVVYHVWILLWVKLKGSYLFIHISLFVSTQLLGPLTNDLLASARAFKQMEGHSIVWLFG
jgi:hypothetical protein